MPGSARYPSRGFLFSYHTGYVASHGCLLADRPKENHFKQGVAMKYNTLHQNMCMKRPSHLSFRSILCTKQVGTEL